MRGCLYNCEAKRIALLTLTPITRLVPICVWGALIFTTVFISISVSSAAPNTFEQRYFVDIPSQSLADALNKLSEDTEQLVLYPYQIANTLSANAVKGEHTLREIMTIMLEGTGYQGGLTKKGVLTILLTKSEADLDNKKSSETTMQKKTKQTLASSFMSLFAFSLGIENTFAESAGGATIEEIIVTAERRESNLQKTPIAMSVFTSAQIERDQLLDTRDLARLSPSLTFNQALAGSQIYIRGVGQGNPITGNSAGVALHIDGVYLGHPYTNNASFYDAERFEVLRGPQGTLYGRNSTGGSINIITKSPSMEPEFRSTFGFGSHGRKWLKTAGNLVVKEGELAVRGSAVLDRRDGYVDNNITKQDVDDRDLTSYSLSAFAAPNDLLAIEIKGDYQRDERYEKPISHVLSVPGSGLDPTLFGAQTSKNDAKIVYNDQDRLREDTFWGTNATVVLNLAEVTVKSITAYRESDNLGGAGDNDGTSFPVVSIEADTQAEEFTQEISFTGSAKDGTFDWIAGANYYRDDVNTVSLSVLPFLTNFLPPVPAIAAINGEAISLAALASSYTEELTSKSVFAQIDYNATDHLTLTAGARYTDDSKVKLQTVRSNITAPSTQCETLRDSKDWSAVTWKLGANLDLTPNAMIYSSVSSGFKAGGFNSGACDDDYDEETITSYEVGFKSNFLDNRLMLNGAAFWYDYTDLQVRAFQGATLQITNAGESEIYGLELDTIYQPNELWRFDFGIAILNAEFTKADLDDPMVPGINPINVSGNRMERSPDLKYSFGAQLTLGNIDYRYELSYSDDMYVDQFENDFSMIESFTEQNFRIIWRPKGSARLNLQAFVENLTNEQYFDYLIPISAVGGVAGAYAPPRTWGLLVNWDIL